MIPVRTLRGSVNYFKDAMEHNVTWVKKIILILLALGVIFGGITLGENLMDLTPGPFGAGFVLIGLILIGWFLGKPGRKNSWFLATAFPFLLILSWTASSLDLSRATLACEGQLDSLRAELVQFRKEKGRFPISLEELGRKTLPGGRLIGKNILHYDFGVKSYRMYISPQARKEPWNSCSVPRKK